MCDPADALVIDREPKLLGKATFDWMEELNG